MIRLPDRSNTRARCGHCGKIQIKLQKVLYGLLRSLPGVEIEMIGFDGDHLHLVMVIYSISDVMGSLKSQLSSVMRKKFKWLAKVYWKENILWSPGYFISSVGIDEATPSKGMLSSKDEFRSAPAGAVMKTRIPVLAGGGIYFLTYVMS